MSAEKSPVTLVLKFQYTVEYRVFHLMVSNLISYMDTPLEWTDVHFIWKKTWTLGSAFASLILGMKMQQFKMITQYCHCYVTQNSLLFIQANTEKAYVKFFISDSIGLKAVLH